VDQWIVKGSTRGEQLLDSIDIYSNDVLTWQGEHHFIRDCCSGGAWKASQIGYTSGISIAPQIFLENAAWEVFPS
jgi:hypothetical protein